MEPFLETLKERLISEYGTEKSVLVCPVTEDRDDMAFFQINKAKQCRVFYYDVTIPENKKRGTETYTFAGTPMLAYHYCKADRYKVVLDKDNGIARLLKNFIFNHFSRHVGWWVEEEILNIIQKYKRNPKLIDLLNDAGVFRNLYDLNCVPDDKTGSIKEVFGVSVKYLRASGIGCVDGAKFLWENHFSPKEAQKLFSLLGQWEILGDNFSLRQLKYIANSNMSYVWDYRDYCSMRKFLISEKIDVSSFPECPLDSSSKNIKRLHDLIVPIHNRARKIADKRSMEEKTKMYLEAHYPDAQKFEYENDKYSIIACKDLLELGREGSELHHCVGSYVDSVRAGNEYILFLRKKTELDVPYFTVDVLPNKNVRQIHGKCNCNVPPELMPFVKKWAKEKELNIAGINGIRCHV
jgi:hypothetical protein